MTERDLAICLTLTFVACVSIMFFVWFIGPDTPVEGEIQQKSRHIGFDGSSFHVEVITVDGVEYIVAKTYRGVGITRK